MSETVLVLRTCNADMTAHGGFRWPESGPVEAPDWNPEPVCGGGLHGALWGEGNGTMLDFSPDARWLVVEVPADTVVDLGGRVKFPWGVVVCCGDRDEATQYMLARAPGRAVIGACVAAGYRGQATAGYRGQATAGYRGIIQVRQWDAVASRWRLVTGYVGENGIRPGFAYRLDDAGNFVEVGK